MNVSWRSCAVRSTIFPSLVVTFYTGVVMAGRSRPNKAVDVFQFIDMSGGWDSCWEYMRSLHKGRPYFEYDGKKRLAYRIVYELYYGVELATDDIVRHKCDNPPCCNPRHLTLGSHQDNMNDMVERERHGMPKYAVRQIMRLLKQGKKHAEIAEIFGCSRETVTAINNRRRSVPDEEDKGDDDT